MSGTLVNLIIQLIAGIVGGTAAGKALKDYDLGGLEIRSRAQSAAWAEGNCSRC